MNWHFRKERKSKVSELPYYNLIVNLQPYEPKCEPYSNAYSSDIREQKDVIEHLRGTPQFLREVVYHLADHQRYNVSGILSMVHKLVPRLKKLFQGHEVFFGVDWGADADRSVLMRGHLEDGQLVIDEMKSDNDPLTKAHKALAEIMEYCDLGHMHPDFSTRIIGYVDKHLGEEKAREIWRRYRSTPAGT